jgi:flagellar protein FliJ
VKSRKFKLEPVLKIRRLEEQAAAAVSGAAAMRAREAKDAAAAAHVAALEAQVAGECDGQTFMASMFRTRQTGADAALAREVAAQQEEVARQASTEWTAAAQRTKGLEKLRDRHVAKVKRDADIAEVRMVDDIVTRTYAVRNQQQGHQ